MHNQKFSVHIHLQPVRYQTEDLSGRYRSPGYLLWQMYWCCQWFHPIQGLPTRSCSSIFPLRHGLHQVSSAWSPHLSRNHLLLRYHLWFFRLNPLPRSHCQPLLHLNSPPYLLRFRFLHSLYLPLCQHLLRYFLHLPPCSQYFRRMLQVMLQVHLPKVLKPPCFQLFSFSCENLLLINKNILFSKLPF